MAKVESAPGLRFHPTDVELVRYYLKRKVLGMNLQFDGISVVDIYKHPPWDLPGKSAWKSNDRKWYFFCPREKKYASGSRMNRSTELGYWKTTGRERSISCNKEVVGKIKTLVFHRGKSPKGERTDWVMYEYRLHDKDLIEKGIDVGIFVLCAIFKKDGRGPKNGAQYGAPFREEDWPDLTDGVKSEENNKAMFNISDISGPSCETPAHYNEILSYSLDVLLSPRPPHSDNRNKLPLTEVDDIETMLNYFGVDDDFHENNVTPVTTMAESFFDGSDIYDTLDDLENLEFGGPLNNDAPCNSEAGKFGSDKGWLKEEEGGEEGTDRHMESRGEILVVGCSFVVDDDGFFLRVKAEVTHACTKDAFLHDHRSFNSSLLSLFFVRSLALLLFVNHNYSLYYMRQTLWFIISYFSAN